MSNKKRQEASGHHANLTQDMLNELNKHTLPGYEHYMHYPSAGGGPMGGMAGGPYDDYDTDAAWNSDRYYGGSGGQRYKVGRGDILYYIQYLGYILGLDTSSGNDRPSFPIPTFKAMRIRLYAMERLR